MAWESFQLLTLTFDPFFSVKWGRLTAKALYLSYYLPPAAKGHSREIIKRLLYVHACVRVCVSLSCFNINLNFSFIYKDIFSKFAVNVYGFENVFVENFGLILKNKMATIANF